jgi:hypothetical protein
MAASIPGVLLIPGANGAADGFSVLGLDPSDNTITMNGMTFDGGDLPRDAGPRPNDAITIPIVIVERIRTSGRPWYRSKQV